MADNRTVLVTGVTGQQGGAVARELLGKGFKLRGMTRKPEGDAARALAAKGVEIIKGDLNDVESLGKALAGAWGVFAVQNTWEAGVQGEEEQGKRIATLAREKGVSHFVYSSVGSAHLKTGIPHFDNKSRVEDTIRGLGFASTAILRPVFFMENMLSPWFLHGDKIITAMKPDTSLLMIAVDDVGRYGARAFTHAEEMKGTELDIAGDSLTMPQAAEAMSRAMGKKIEFTAIPISEVRKNSEDFALMLEWFERGGYSVDIAANERKYGIPATKFATWLKQKFPA